MRTRRAIIKLPATYFQPPYYYYQDPPKMDLTHSTGFTNPFTNPLAALGIGSQGLIGALGVAAMIAEKLPGYSVIHDQLRKFNIDLGTVATCVMIPTALWTVWTFVTRNVYIFLERYYCCSVRITSEDGLFQELFSWLREEHSRDISNARICDAKKHYEISEDHVGGVDPYGSPYPPDPYNSPGRTKSQVVYNPAVGTLYRFKHNGYTIHIVREKIHDPVIMPPGPPNPVREAVNLKYYGRSPDILKAVLDDVLKRSNQRDQGKTVVYQAIVSHHGNRWDRCMSRPKRSISTVILEEDQKARVVEDIEEYLLPATGKWYANRGLPYRRGYLLYGPPGTGKTSLSMALAGHFNLEVYSLSLTAQNLTDDNLASLFTLLPKHCIILLEDVDASGVKRSEDSFTPSPPETPLHPRYNMPYGMPPLPPAKSKVTFSGLINAIDGAAAKEGRILIMTTNHREKLDEALIRPGRVDLQIAFSYASRAVIEELFVNLYDVSADEEAALYMPPEFPSRKEVGELAKRFAGVVPEGRFTPAEIQGLLLLWKKDPGRAVEEAKGWVERKGEREGREREGREVKAGVEPS